MEEVYDVDMLNVELFQSQQYVINSQQELTASLNAEIGQLHNERVDLVKNTNKLRDERDELIEERNKLKQERKLLRAEKIDLKMDIAHFKKDGAANRKKISQLSVILDEE